MLVFFALLFPLVLPAAEQYNKDFSFELRDVTVKDVFRYIEKNSEYVFLYASDKNLSKIVDVDVKNKNVKQILDEVLEHTGLVYEIDGKQIIVKEQRTFTPSDRQQSTLQQTKKVYGVVKDEAGETIIGANVWVKDTQTGVVTDINGRYQLTLNIPNPVLVFSYLGMKTQEVMVGDKSEINVVLAADTEVLDEVVVVGFGTQKKANLTGAVTTVKMEDALGERPLTSASEALQGAVPGLLVSSGGNAVGDSKTFQIRGAYSLGIQNSDGSYGARVEPLVLIDNVEGDIDLLNPDDIESITVLKDAASTAIYGARAAGGVILVTTKRPKNNTRFQLNYNNNFAFSNAINLPKQAALRTYLQAYRDYSGGDNYWSYGTPSVSRWLELLDQYQTDPSSVPTQGDGIYKEGTALYYLNEKDLVENILESSFKQTHNLSVSGGTDKLRYRLSAGMVDSDGVLITSKDSYRRMNVSAFISADITSWFTQEANISYAHSKRTTPLSSVGAIYGTRLISYYPEGTMPEGYGKGDENGLPFFTPRNQILYANTGKTLYDNPRIFLKSILKPLKGLEIAFEYTFDKNIYDYHYYTGIMRMTTIQGGASEYPSNDYLRKTKRYTDYNAINLYGTYSFDLATDHHFKVMAGFNQESSYRETMENYSYGQAVPEVPSLGGGTSTLTARDTYSEYAVRGGFFRVNYNYKDRYLLEVNGRYDGSSRFPKDDRFGFFPSVSVGWNITQEDFMSSMQEWLNMLKPRASYGMIGNQNIVEYAFIPSMTINNTYNGWLIDGNRVAAITTLPSLVSSTFTWEKVKTANVGIDFALFNSRLTGLFEWYQKNTMGMLAPGMQLPAVVGANAPYQNTADMRTRGWEINLNWRDRINDWGYSIGFNLSDSKSVITKYNSNESKLLSSFYEGQELGEIWGYVYDGFYTVDDFTDTQTWQLKDGVTTINGYNPRPGDVKFKNLRDDEIMGENVIYEGEGTLENPGDRIRIGNNLPRYLYGINLGANYKGFDLSIFLQGTGKRDAWIANNVTFPMYADANFIALYEGTENYWKPVDATNGDYTCANPDAEFPRIYGNYGNQGSNYRRSDRYLSDASYLRIKNMTLSYNFPKTWMNKISLSALKAFVSIENLATFSSLAKGIDPETLSWNYPAFRSVSFGINLSL